MQLRPSLSFSKQKQKQNTKFKQMSPPLKERIGTSLRNSPYTAFHLDRQEKHRRSLNRNWLPRMEEQRNKTNTQQEKKKLHKIHIPKPEEYSNRMPPWGTGILLVTEPCLRPRVAGKGPGGVRGILAVHTGDLPSLEAWSLPTPQKNRFTRYLLQKSPHLVPRPPDGQRP